MATKKEKNSIPVYSSKATYVDHSMYISGEIEDADLYVEALDILRMAGKDDTITIYLNSVGGYFWTAVQICNAIRQSKAQVTIQIDGEAHSAASLICLAGDSWVIPETASMMCHYVTTGYKGKIHEIGKWHTHMEKHFKGIFKMYYEGFLTDKEIDNVIGGDDIWLCGSEIKVRLDKMLVYREKQDKLAEAAEKKAAEKSKKKQKNS